MEQLLYEIYYNPKTGFQSKKQLYQKAKTLNNKITQKIVRVDVKLGYLGHFPKIN